MITTSEKITQQNKILALLKRGYILTPADAYREVGTMKLATRVGELIRKGHPILKIWKPLPNGKKVMSYKMAIDEAV